jgi:hypothetical protein
VQRAAHALQSGQRDPHTATLGQSEKYLQKAMQHSLQCMPGAAASMFLDAACALDGRRASDVLLAWQLWHGEEAYGLFELLKSRHLVGVDEEGRVQVHDVLRWFGRMVVLGNTSMGAALRGSRLWVEDAKVAGQGTQVRCSSGLDIFS